MSLGGSKPSQQTSVTDPLAQQKTQAANQSLSAWSSLLPYANQLTSTYMPQLGQTDFTSQTPQLLQDIYKAVQGDVEGTGGPFTSLKQNLLGSFDTGAQKFTIDPLKEQLIKEGLYSSGPGMDVLQNAGTNIAQQRGLLGSQVDTQLLNMANSLGQQQFNTQQQLGFQDPLQALQAAYGLVTPPGSLGTNIATSTMQVPGQSSGIGGLLGTIAGQAIPAMFTGGASLPFTAGASGIGALGNSLYDPMQAFGTAGIASPSYY